jgi:hypothetical protein
MCISLRMPARTSIVHSPDLEEPSWATLPPGLAEGRRGRRTGRRCADPRRDVRGPAASARTIIGRRPEGARVSAGPIEQSTGPDPSSLDFRYAVSLSLKVSLLSKGNGHSAKAAPPRVSPHGRGFLLRRVDLSHRARRVISRRGHGRRTLGPGLGLDPPGPRGVRRHGRAP